EKVPGWDGDPKTWHTYRRKALQYQEGTKREDRYLCGARLEARLTSRAEVAVKRCKPGWLSRASGVKRLLAWLERRCSRQAVPDVGCPADVQAMEMDREGDDETEDSHHWSAAAPDAEAEEEVAEVPEVFPGLVLGWVMLARSGLDSRQRSAILTATSGSLDVSIMREKLASSWEDDDLAERDGQGKYPKAYAAQLGEDDRAGEDGEEDNMDAGSFVAGQGPPGMYDEDLDQAEANEDDIETYLAAHHEEAEALAAIHSARRTLRQAREAQADSHLSRGFYRGGRPANPAKRGGRGSGGGFPAGSRRPMGTQFGGRGQLEPPNTGQKKCTKCGGAHWLQDCPDRHGPRLRGGPTSAPDASARVATCRKELKFNLVAAMAAEQGSGGSPCEAMFAEQAIREGKGIADLGCAGAMGGARALDIVARKNMEKYGEARLQEVNHNYRLVCSIGNGEKGRACGQVKFGIAGAGVQGDIAIDGFAKDAPILVSKQVLKKLGAIVDCDAGVAVFVELAPGAPVQLEESPDSGHYYMSLVGDLLEQWVQGPTELQNFIENGRHIPEWGWQVCSCEPARSPAYGLIDTVELPAPPDLPYRSYSQQSPVDGREMRCGGFLRGAMQLACAQTARQCDSGKGNAVKVICSLAWSSDELKQIIKDDLSSRNETEARGAVGGISSMGKAELIEEATEVGAHVAPNMTSASLKLAIREAVRRKTATEPTDYVGFGKHGALTYRQVLNQYPPHAEWAKKEANAEGSWELAGFVSWLTVAGVVQPETQISRGYANVPAGPAKEMMSALGQLSQRLERFEG
ncbi:unnamed protein product, partial [Prorocentrum cordatum]